MEYNSFYGGRRGASFIIVEKFSSIREMVNNFQQGGNYKTVNYDEYVIIDTENKNDPDNGKIFRRGYDFNNDMGGATYEGQIVGPAGLAPQLQFSTIDDVKSMARTEGFEYRSGSGEYSVDNDSLIPGKYVELGTQDIIFNDEIKWEYCSVRDINKKDTTAYIGFKVPFTVVDFEAVSVDAYYNRSNNTANFINKDLVRRIDDETHPFYEKWGISIPKGIKGDSLKNLRVMVADNTIEAYEGQADDVAAHREVIVYDYYVFDKEKNGEHKILYVGQYNMIKSISVSDKGEILIKYTHDNDTTYKLHVPTKTELSRDYHLLVTYGTETTPTDLGYIGNGTGIGALVGKESDSAIVSLASHLPPYSAWLIIEED